MTIYSLFILYALLGLSKRDNKLSIHKQTGISVIIPFRNEGKNVLSLGNYLKKKAQHYKIEVIWINDHSTDQNFPPDFLNSRQISLNKTYGKKNALLEGVLHAKFDKILTLDADITLPDNFFNSLMSYWKDQDLFILPVISGGKGSLQKLVYIESISIAGLTLGLCKSGMPVLSNGAALGYNKKVWLEASKSKKFMTYASGDDMYMLQYFKSAKKSITCSTHTDLIVNTLAPDKLDKLLSQRIRWAGKFPSYTDMGTIVFGSATFFMYLLLILSTLVILNQSEWLIWGLLMFFKWFIDFLLLFLVKMKLKLRWSMINFVIVQFLYPFYAVLIPLISLFYLPKWKGRSKNVS